MYNRHMEGRAASYLYTCSLCNSLGVAVGADDLFPIIITSCALAGEAIFFHPSHPIPADTTLNRPMTFGCVRVYTIIITYCTCTMCTWPIFLSLQYRGIVIYIIHSYIHRLIGRINLFSLFHRDQTADIVCFFMASTFSLEVLQ